MADVHDFPDTADAADSDAPASDGALRLAHLEKALKDRHPPTRHAYLAYLAVTPDQQNRGIGTELLRDHLTGLHRTGTPAYLEANDPRNRQLYLRHGFTDLGPAVTVDGCPPVQPMWCTRYSDTDARRP